MNRYRVVIHEGGMTDPLAQVTTFHVIDTDAKEVMLNGGGWMQIGEGDVMPSPSIVLPSEAMEALVEAIDRWRGQPSHAKTEAAVLREWLAKEQSRVDEVFRAVGKPIVFDR